MKHLPSLFFTFLLALPALAASLGAEASAKEARPLRQAQGRPNILWLVLEDTSPWAACYGTRANEGHTPNIDSLADKGVLFERAYVPAPVCSPCRSSIITGASQIRGGCHEHRSSRVKGGEIHLPEGWKLLPQVLKENGYYTFNIGKTDYNFVWDSAAVYDVNTGRSKNPYPWREAAKGQPFFGQIQMKGGKGNGDKFPEDRKVDPATVTVPADYPPNQLHREIVAEHLNTIRKNDDEVGQILARLREDKLLDNTIVCWFSDHGANHLLRHKQMATEGGLHVPFIVVGPKKWVPQKPGTRRKDLVDILDLSATTVAWAGLGIPSWFEGLDLFAPDHQPREFVASARDRCDQTIDSVRSLRTERFRYTRNLLTDRNLLQPQYRDGRPPTNNFRELYASGELDPVLAQIYFGERQPEELHDLQNDPHQLVNLLARHSPEGDGGAMDPMIARELKRHRRLMDDWLARGDMGDKPEPMATYIHEGTKSRFARNAHNVEYEQVRPDSDGDGLSDMWETNNKRDPADGKFMFLFDCGGWMTEGWASTGTDALPGLQGFLDFTLTEPKGVLTRKGLKLDAAKNSTPLNMRTRVSAPTLLSFTTTPPSPSELSAQITPDRDFANIFLPVDWPATTTAVQLTFEAPKGTRIEIDSIR
jgi:arylsulfatase A-like enzyme